MCDWFSTILDSLTVFKSVEICRILFCFGIFISLSVSYRVVVLEPLFYRFLFVLCRDLVFNKNIFFVKKKEY
jgi:hypothetical protein